MKRHVGLMVAGFLLSNSYLSFASESDYEKAIQAFYQQNYDESYIHLKNTLKDNPQDISAKVLLSRVYIEKGFIKPAIVEIEEALQLNADINLVLKNYLLLLVLDKQYERVTLIDESKISTEANLYELALAKGTAYQELMLIELSKESFEQAIRMTFADARAYNSLSRIELTEGNLPRAKALLTRSLEITPNNSRTLLLQSQIAIEENKLAEAIDALHKARSVNEDDVLIKRALITAYIKDNRLDDAESLLNDLLASGSSDAKLKLLSSWLLSVQNKEQEAADTLEELANSLSLYSEEAINRDPSLMLISAISFYTQGNTESARKELQKYLIKVPTDIRAIDLLAKIYIEEGNNKDAMYLLENHFSLVSKSVAAGSRLISLYEKSTKSYDLERLLVELNNNFPNERYFALQLVRIYSKSGRIAMAERLLASVDESEGSVGYLLAKGSILIENNNVSDALEIVKALNEKTDITAENKSQVDNFVGAVSIKEGKPAQAEQYLVSALKHDSEFFEAKFNLATALKMQQRYPQAKEILAELSKIAPNNNAVKVSLAQTLMSVSEMNKAIEVLKSVTVGDNLTLAKELLFDLQIREGLTEEALTTINELNDLSLYNRDYLLKKVSTLVALGLNDQAKRQIGIVFGLAENDAKLLYEVARWQRIVKDFDGADKTLNKLSSLVPKNLFVKTEKVALLIAKGQLSSAIKFAKSLVESTGGNPNALHALGDAFVANGDVEFGFDSYWQAIEIDDEFDVVTLKLFELAAQGVNVDKVTALLERQVKQYPSEQWRVRLLADHYFNIGNKSTATQLYTELLNEPTFAKDPFLLNNLSVLKINSDPKLSLQLAEDANNLKPNDANILDTLAWSLAQNKQLDRALNLLRTAYTLDSSNLDIRYHLAYVLHNLNRHNESKRELDYILSSNPNADMKSKAMKLRELM